jgi:hypothetical protein
MKESLLIRSEVRGRMSSKEELSRAPLNSNPFLIKTKYTAVSTKHHKPSLFLVYMLMGMEHGT